MAAKSSSAKYYASHPEARKKKNEYQSSYNKKPSEVKKRTLLNKENRKRGTYGNGDGKDVSHQSDGSTRLEAQSKNRGNKTRTPGDRRARG